MKTSIALALPLFALAAACARPQQTAPAAPVGAVSLTSATVDATRPELAPPAFEAPILPLSRWETRFPDAAVTLGTWAQSYPQTAGALSTLQQADPVKMKVLIDWSVTNVDDAIGAFFLDHEGWGALHDVINRDPAGFNAFLSWTRAAPDAAAALDWQPAVLSLAARRPNVLASVTAANPGMRPSDGIDWNPTGWHAGAQ